MSRPQGYKARGALGNPDVRFESRTREAVDDGWHQEEAPDSIATQLTPESARTIISRNSSPDVPFSQSINPYRGCEHGCIYCFARPTHAYLGLSPGIDFETRLLYKPEAAELLRRELARPRYRCVPIMLGINTDAYQPVERRLGITRALLEVFVETRHPVMIITKSALIERDADLLADLARDGLAQAVISMTSLDPGISQTLEPRAAPPKRRLLTIERLTAAGIPVSVLVAPLIPVLTDHELERILEAVHAAGALEAAYTLLRLPHETKGLFEEWLREHHPLKADHVLARIRDCHGGKEYDSRFGTRMTGGGIFAELIRRRFHLAERRLGFPGTPELRCDRFRRPVDAGGQLSLF